MQRIDLVINTPISRTSRARQLEAMFDVPASETSRVEWHGDVPIDEEDWSVGLIVGPSGVGKSTVARALFGEQQELRWEEMGVIDNFDRSTSIEDIASACQSVGFNTIPAWLRPFNVLSTGERFRVDVARRMLELPSPIVIDEFTSVVDRQVAKIASHAVQKFVRKTGKKLVAVSCHYDIIDWLQPDWMLEPATMTFSRRSLRQRPPLELEVFATTAKAWPLFSRFHYLTSSLLPNATCFACICEGAPAGFLAVRYFPHSSVRNMYAAHRLVVLPDYQGCGIGPAMKDVVASAYRALGYRFRSYPAHPAYVRTLDRSKRWSLVKKPGTWYTVTAKTGPIRFGGRPNAVFEYIGEAMADRQQALALVFGAQRAVMPGKNLFSRSRQT